MRIIECFVAAFFFFFGPLHLVSAAAPAGAEHPKIEFPKPLDEYQDDQAPNLLEKLFNRAKGESFNLIATLIFAVAQVRRDGWSH